MEDIVQLLLKRTEIRRQIPSRKSVQENKSDRISDLLEAAASEILKLRVELKSAQNQAIIEKLSSHIKINEWVPVEKNFWKFIIVSCDDLEPIDVGHDKHCWDVTYQIEGRQYNLLFENGNEYPIEITAKDIE